MTKKSSKNICTMKISIINTFLFFLVLLSSPFNISSKTTTPHHKPTLNDALIHELCKPALDPNACTQILNKFKGIPLMPKPLQNLVNDLQLQAAQTKKKILFVKNSVAKQKKPKLIANTYQTCWDEYTHAMTQLKEAIKSISHAKIGDVKVSTLNAMGHVNSCDGELAKIKREESAIGKDNKKFKEICSVVLVICDKLIHPVHVA